MHACILLLSSKIFHESNLYINYIYNIYIKAKIWMNTAVTEQLIIQDKWGKQQNQRWLHVVSSKFLAVDQMTLVIFFFFFYFVCFGVRTIPKHSVLALKDSIQVFYVTVIILHDSLWSFSEETPMAVFRVSEVSPCLSQYLCGQICVYSDRLCTC